MLSRSIACRGLLLRVLSIVLAAFSLVVPSISQGGEEVEQFNQRARQLYEAGKYAEAVPYALKVVELREKALGPEHPTVANALNNLAGLYYFLGDYAKAQPLLQRVLTLQERVLGPEHPEVAISLNNLGQLHHTLGAYAEAEPLLQRALRMSEKTLGPEHPYLTHPLGNLADLYQDLGDYAKAQPLLQRALKIAVQGLGLHHPEVATTLNSLATLYHHQGDFGRAAELYQQALEIREKTLGVDHPDVATSLNNLAALYSKQGDYAKAVSLLQRALQLWEKTLGLNHPHVARALASLSQWYVPREDDTTLTLLYQRSLDILEKSLGPNHPDVARCLSSLAVLYKQRGDLVQAESLYQRAIAIWEQALGPAHPEVAKGLNNLATLYQSRSLYHQAESLYQRAIAIWEQALGPAHPEVAKGLNNLAELYRAQSLYTQAEPLYRRALAIWEQALGSAHPEVAIVLNNLALMLAGQRQAALARPLLERARRIHLTVAQTTGELEDAIRRALVQQAASSLRVAVELLASMARESQSFSTALEAFVVTEQARGGAAQMALSQAGARATASAPATAQLARQVQELHYRRQAAWKYLLTAYSKPSAPPSAERLRTQQQTVEQLDRDIAEATDRLHRAFPPYAELVAPEPIEVQTVQELLHADEALVSFFSLEDRLLMWLIRPGHQPVYWDLDLPKTELTTQVTKVRASLELHNRQLPPFDVISAHGLYTRLFAPLQKYLSGVRHLFVVPDDVLLPLPFGVLVTQAMGAPYETLAALAAQPRPLASTDLASYAQLAWLVKEYALTVLPSATSLRVLRQLRRPTEAEREPLIGFGDPVLQGGNQQRGGAMLARRGPAVNLAALRKLDRLPATREELGAVATVLGADPHQALYLGERATESMVRALNTSGRLGRAQVLAFATHGLLAGQLTGLTQPALVLTPPATPSEQDDGLLDVEDILGLHLTHTEWVILSACQTAAGDGSGEGLSGLVRAFFFAGARTLLVSHWSIDDRATQALMTAVFRRYARAPTVARAEALRQGILALMAGAQGQTAYFAHPFAWAPFFLVGEGGKDRPQ